MPMPGGKPGGMKGMPGMGPPIMGPGTMPGGMKGPPMPGRGPHPIWPPPACYHLLLLLVRPEGGRWAGISQSPAAAPAPVVLPPAALEGHHLGQPSQHQVQAHSPAPCCSLWEGATWINQHTGCVAGCSLPDALKSTNWLHHSTSYNRVSTASDAPMGAAATRDVGTGRHCAGQYRCRGHVRGVGHIPCRLGLGLVLLLAQGLFAASPPLQTSPRTSCR